MKRTSLLLDGVLVGLSILTPIVSALPAGFQKFYTPLPAAETQDTFAIIRSWSASSPEMCPGGGSRPVDLYTNKPRWL